jgi:antitoxin component YwqK of YwqJK toxin-antitoxin module
VKLFDERGHLLSLFHMKDGVKHGEEWVYYPSLLDNHLQTKLYIHWSDGIVQGMARTWYPNGVLESEREISDNKKQGVASAWYRDGSLMMIEEYENDELYRGTYMKKGSSHPISSVENGEGTATLYDPDGFFLKKIPYSKGHPVDDI